MKYFVRILSILAMRMLHSAYWKNLYGCSFPIFLLKLHFCKASKLFKKRLQHIFFHMNILKCLRNPILKNISERVFLYCFLSGFSISPLLFSIKRTTFLKEFLFVIVQRTLKGMVNKDFALVSKRHFPLSVNGLDRLLL